MGLRIYLAGPDVFLPNAREISAAKQQICSTYGYIGLSPVDAEASEVITNMPEVSMKVSLSNEEKIRNCQVVVADLTPFRGPSADVGTAYELGLARGLDKFIFAYTNDERDLLSRIKQSGAVEELKSGRMVDAAGMTIENYGLPDNLMLVGAVRSSGSHIIRGTTSDVTKFLDLTAFARCILEIHRRFGFVH